MLLDSMMLSQVIKYVCLLRFSVCQHTSAEANNADMKQFSPLKTTVRALFEAIPPLVLLDLAP